MLHKLNIHYLTRSQKQWPEDLMLKKMLSGKLFHHCAAECQKSFLVEAK